MQGFGDKHVHELRHSLCRDGIAIAIANGYVELQLIITGKHW